MNAPLEESFGDPMKDTLPLRQSDKRKAFNTSFTDSLGLMHTLTEGGPVGATEVMVYKIYFDGFKGLDYSGAAAQSIVLMVIVTIAALLYFRAGRGERIAL